MYHDGLMTDHGPYRICLVCSGNICRSPMAEVVLRHLAEEAGLADLLQISSAGTGDWHIGERADRRTVAALAGAGYDGSRHRAQQFDPRWFADLDLVIACDRGHQRTLWSWAGAERERGKVALLRSFDPDLEPGAAADHLDVPDPYYEEQQAFDDVLRRIEACCRGLLTQVRESLGQHAGQPGLS
jgi:protein-tyrosine phosphatase